MPKTKNKVRDMTNDKEIGNPITKKYQVYMADLSTYKLKPDGNLIVTCGFVVLLSLAVLFLTFAA